LVVIDDAILPTSTLFKYKDLEIVDIPLGIPGWDKDKNCIIPGDEFSEYIDNEYKKAKNKANKSTTLKNKMFWIGVADGSACYIVVKENKKTVKVEWRGFANGDRYVDEVLGYECTVDKNRAKQMI